MSNLVVVSVYDVAVGAFMRPWFVRTKSEAVRALTQEVKKSDSPLSANPKDYQLFYLGEFDEQQGKLLPLDLPEKIVDVSALLQE